MSKKSTPRDERNRHLRPNAHRARPCRLADDVAVYAVAHDDETRWRWAVWSSPRHVRDGAFTWANVVIVREPFAGGVAYSEAEAVALARRQEPNAVRIAKRYATLAYMQRDYAERDRLLAEADAKNEEPLGYAKRLDQRSYGLVRADAHAAAGVIDMLAWLRAKTRSLERERVGGQVIPFRPTTTRRK